MLLMRDIGRCEFESEGEIMIHEDNPPPDYPVPEESVITNAVYAAQKARIVELAEQLEAAREALKIERFGVRCSEHSNSGGTAYTVCCGKPMSWKADESRLSYAELKACNRKFKQAIDEIHTLVESLPSGIDYEANPNDISPADVVAFVGGLIWQICKRVK